MSQTPGNSEIVSILAEIELTRDLSDEARAQVATQCLQIDVAAGRPIEASVLHQARCFLVDGHVTRHEYGLTETLEAYAGLSEPIDLIGDDSAPDWQLRTETPCMLLQIPTAALAAVLSTGVEVTDIELDPQETAFLTELYQLINSNQLALPARPEVALKVQELTSDPDTGIDQLTEIIQRDGTIAGALLHTTNSPLFRAVKEIKTIREAVLRLGFRNTRMLAVNIALRQAFHAKHQLTRQAMQDSWNESVLCSVYSYVIAEVSHTLDRERALLAGLVAGIGAVPIIQFIEARGATQTAAVLQSLITKLASITGVLVINYWALGDDLVSVAEHYGDWNYHAPAPDYASIAIVARWAALYSEGRAVPDAQSVPAFGVLGLVPPLPGEPITELADSEPMLKKLKSMFNL
ncbi:HD-like signal output (HDOD) domain, no enzymatic activity [Allochromatium warmingii]|uniref:HD-like signal output (HDOD) domain, no enzymatic activity n=1 Tax=Allochromatium warmingii TaxID=61595 RepID=A0A1H3E448_ALLWA|nr:HDOD domain-containing protein [Allochromatium warmingii]SDX73387.1 HD-like signal output (HDOD) domain, no enzymatic activity [Allochromatium warmingii]